MFRKLLVGIVFFALGVTYAIINTAAFVPYIAKMSSFELLRGALGIFTSAALIGLGLATIINASVQEK